MTAEGDVRFCEIDPRNENESSVLPEESGGSVLISTAEYARNMKQVNNFSLYALLFFLFLFLFFSLFLH